ncbi:MAG TPA: hypothetical protein VF630_10470 [Hymenobacter sp.]
MGYGKVCVEWEGENNGLGRPNDEPAAAMGPGKRVAKVKHPLLRPRSKINPLEKQPASFQKRFISEKTYAWACRPQFFSPTFAAPKRKTHGFPLGKRFGSSVG